MIEDFVVIFVAVKKEEPKARDITIRYALPLY